MLCVSVTSPEINDIAFSKLSRNIDNKEYLYLSFSSLLSLDNYIQYEVEDINDVTFGYIFIK